MISDCFPHPILFENAPCDVIPIPISFTDYATVRRFVKNLQKRSPDVQEQYERSFQEQSFPTFRKSLAQENILAF